MDAKMPDDRYTFATYPSGFIAFEYGGAVYEVPNDVPMDDPELVEALPTKALAILKEVRELTSKRAKALADSMALQAEASIP